MGDRNLNELLKWSIQNSTEESQPTTNGTPSSNRAALPAPEDFNTTEPITTSATPPAHRPLDPQILEALMGGPSDADLMRASMTIIQSPEQSLEDKLIAFDNFEQLIESIDNANNLGALSLWSPLLALLADKEPEVRRYAAWCIGTAVQNNVKAQEKLLEMGGLPNLVAMVARREGETGEPSEVRRKVVYALSSAVRNYQPSMDVLMEELQKQGDRTGSAGQVDAEDMDAVDVVINGLRESI